MHEIKKIYPQSLAKYFSLIAAFIAFVFGLLNFVISVSGVVRFMMRSLWQDQVISWFVSVLFFYVIFWIIGYLFAVIYNLIAQNTKGIIIEFKVVNLDKSENDSKKQIENDVEKHEEKDSFIV